MNVEDNFKFQGRRRLLALELKKKGIVNEQIIKSIESVPRHLFIDPGLSEQAYIDKALPIESNQTISQPYTVAFQTQLLNPVSGEKILEIGTGSGYQTSILCFLKTDVYTIERNHNLFRSTTKLFNRLNINPVRFKYGDGYKGLIDDSPFDGILITAGSPNVPEELLKQLKVGGRMVVPIGKKFRLLKKLPEFLLMILKKRLLLFLCLFQ